MAGKKATHWMWFVYPQIQGLGFSSTSKFYAISNTEEAKAYIAHPILGNRLRECCEIERGPAPQEVDLGGTRRKKYRFHAGDATWSLTEKSTKSMSMVFLVGTAYLQKFFWPDSNLSCWIC